MQSLRSGRLIHSEGGAAVEGDRCAVLLVTTCIFVRSPTGVGENFTAGLGVGPIVKDGNVTSRNRSKRETTTSLRNPAPRTSWVAESSGTPKAG